MNKPANTTVRKIHTSVATRAVKVSGPTQLRTTKQKLYSANFVSSLRGTSCRRPTNPGNSTDVTNNSVQQLAISPAMITQNIRCYVCDDLMTNNHIQHPFTDMISNHSSTKFPNKIGQLVGDSFMVVVSVEDVICVRCTNLINYLDRLENDVERVRTNILNLLHKKYGIFDDDNRGNNAIFNANIAGVPTTLSITNNTGNTSATLPNTSTSIISYQVGSSAPPNKLQKLNSGASIGGSAATIHQIKISSGASQQQTSSGTQTSPRKTTKIYKCLSCDYKTFDMRLFNSHYENCKHQTFQCKTCKQIFSHFGSMKLHMIREHNAPMENSCAVCHLNFVDESSLRKHMECNHSTNVVVTSTTTVSVGQAAAAAADHLHSLAAGTAITPLYSCNMCPFKATDKPFFDEHIRKHGNVVSRPKPFKCRLCAQRFETREAANNHAKQHQGNIFKCGTCSISFPKREMLAKHFEIHQAEQQVATTSATQVQQQQQIQQVQQQQQQQIQQVQQQQQIQQVQQQQQIQQVQQQQIQQAQQQQQQQIQVQQQQQIQQVQQQQQQQEQLQQQQLQQQHIQQQQLPQLQQIQQISQTQPLQIQQQQMDVQQQHNAQQFHTRHNSLTTQKLLQETIDEALSDTTTTSQSIVASNLSITATSGPTTIVTGSSGGATINDVSGCPSSPTNSIQFFSCHICSLTFIQENYYNQHMDTHRRTEINGGKKTPVKCGVISMNTISILGDNAQLENNTNINGQTNIDLGIPETTTAADINTGGGGIISESDIESIFEKMHSEKGDMAMSTMSVTSSAMSSMPSNITSTVMSTSMVTTQDSGRITLAANSLSGGNIGTSNEHVINLQGGAAPTVNSGNDISFNITIPISTLSSIDVNTIGEQNITLEDPPIIKLDTSSNSPTKQTPVNMDMPILDSTDDVGSNNVQTTNANINGSESVALLNIKTSIKCENNDSNGAPTNFLNPNVVSMPSLDDEDNVGSMNCTTALTSSNTEMETEDIKPPPNLCPVTSDSDNRNMTTQQPIKVDESFDSNQSTDHNTAIGIATSESLTNSALSVNVNALAPSGGEGNLENSTSDHIAEVGAAMCDQQVAIDLDEGAMQAQVDNGQIKFILNENGQLLQLENHIITDAEGNQILVQDPEQIQQLLQSVGVLQSTDGLDGETLQMMTDANGQMVLVQGDNTDAQLIDASLLNSEGQLIIQPSQDGDGTAHVISDDGTRIPVVVSYTEDGQQIVQVQQHAILGKDCLPEMTVTDDDVAAVAAATGQHMSVPEMSGPTYLGLDDFMQQSPDVATTITTSSSETKAP